jgi:rhodanese-related sulfurtransferase
MQPEGSAGKDERFGPLVVGGIVAGLILPPLLFCLGTRGPSIEPSEAERLMSSDSTAWVLFDVRSREAFESVHIPGAINPAASSFTAPLGVEWRERLAGKTHIMVVCTIGADSTRVVSELRRSGFSQAVSVTGGMDHWLQVVPGGMCFAANGQGGQQGPVELVPRRILSFFEQSVISVTAFGVKPLYELLALIVAILLWRAGESDLAALRRSMIAFFLGENACSVNFFFFDGLSRLWEFLHSFGMIVAFGFFAYACMEAFDSRVVRFSAPDQRCSLLVSCGHCYKYQDVRCPLRRTFLLVTLSAAALAFMPLTAIPSLRYVRGDVFGTDVLFGHPFVAQLFEARLCPLLALPFFLAAWSVLWRMREQGFGLSKVLLAMGLGPLSFGLIRFIIYWGYEANPLWADAWEELTELLFVALAFWVVLGMDQVRGAWPLKLMRGMLNRGGT